VNAIDRIITALTPGTIFNKGGLVYRSLGTLAKFAGLEEDETVALLSGDMAGLVTCKPAKDQQTILIALNAVLDAALPAPAEEENPVDFAIDAEVGAAVAAIDDNPHANPPALNLAEKFGPGYHEALDKGDVHKVVMNVGGGNHVVFGLDEADDDPEAIVQEEE
jgi:hypothetical protein